MTLTEPIGAILGIAWRAVARVLGVLWSVFRPAMRFAGALFLLAATIALVSDLTRWQIGDGGPMFESLAKHIRAFAPASMDAFGARIGRVLYPWVWDPLLLGLLSQPAWVLFALVGFALVYGGRERQRINIFIN